jgi:hypothetical protein
VLEASSKATIQKLGHLLGSQTKNRRRTAKSRSKVSPGSDLVFVARVRSVSALRFFILIVHRSSGVKAERRATAAARGQYLVKDDGKRPSR